MGILKIVADAGPAITDVNTGVWASVIMFLMMLAVALLLISFFRRYKRAANKGVLENQPEEKNEN
jgi:Flp pilus assembly protein TadB